MNLEGKVALVTGGGNGIGRATAIRFAQEGAKIVISDMDENGLELTGHELAKVSNAAGGAFATVVGDVSAREDVEKMVDAATGQYGRLDVLINNAGINRDALMVRVKEGETRLMSDEKWDQVLDVKLKGFEGRSHRVNQDPGPGMGPFWNCCKLRGTRRHQDPNDGRYSR
jgi:3-oxoacyl-[acyl-carrier protein] reductase